MRVVLTKKMVVGHVMRYPGEVVELPDPAPVAPPAEPQSEPELAPEPAPEVQPRARRKP